MARSIQGNAAQLSAYSQHFDQALAECVDRALDIGRMRAHLRTDALYSTEAKVAATMTGFIEMFEPLAAVLLFQVSSALAFEQNNGKLATLLSATKRSKLAEHRQIARNAEAIDNSLVHGPALSRFMSRFMQLSARGS